MRTVRRFYQSLALSAFILSSACTTSDSAELEDGLEDADAGNKVVEVQRDEITDSDIPSPEQASMEAQKAAELAGDSLDNNGSDDLQGLIMDQQAGRNGPDVPGDHPADSSNYQMADDTKAAEPVSDVEAAAAQTASLPSLSQVATESEGDSGVATLPGGEDMLSTGDDADKPALNSVKKKRTAKARRAKVREGRAAHGMDNLSGHFYIVQPGDTLGRISTVIYGTSRRWRDLATANKLDSGSPIYPGDVLRYPADSASADYENAYKGLNRSQIVVKKGDTLELIAARQLGDKAFWKLLWRWNASSISKPNRIFVGQTLDYIAPQDLSALSAERRRLKAAH